MRICIVISQLLCGGTEKQVYQLYRLLVFREIIVRVIVLGKIDDNHFLFNLTDDVCLYHAKNKSNSKFSRNIKKISYIRQMIKDFGPECILSMIDSTNILTLFSSFGLATPVIISERNNPEKSKMSKVWFFLRRIIYPFAQSLVVSNNGLKSVCSYHKYNSQLTIIPNIVKASRETMHDKTLRKIIAVGSLSNQKRFDKLISAIKHLYDNNKLLGFTVDIFGEGGLRSSLQDQIDDSGLVGIISLRGLSTKIEHEYIQSDIFVLCSDYEGQPNVLLEAMSCGLACVSTDCDFGPREIIDHGKNGLLVPVDDINQLASAIHQLISNQELRNKLGRTAQEKIKTEFSQEVIIQKWLDLFKELTQKNARHCTSL